MKICIVNGQEDWSGLYIDGVLIQESHSLDLTRVLEVIAERKEPIDELDWFTLDDGADELLNTRGCLPETLDVVRQWLSSGDDA